MLFSSFGFLLFFLPAVTIVYAAAQRFAGQKTAQAFLLLSSFFFYAWPKPSNLGLLLASILFNWAIARFISRAQSEARRKAWMWTGIACNTAFLSTFKYANFFLRSFAVFHAPKFTLPDWEFPLGISFFTLTQVMYLVDTAEGLNGANSLFDHATFVSFFPYVTSGPLVQARAMIPQLKNAGNGQGRLESASRGLYLFTMGLAKKLLFADSFAKIADRGFGGLQNISTLEAWIFSLAYTFQIYFDFSGYSDMAVGAAWMLGIDIPQNFNAPYAATSISEFWRRWHISLSNFITNYLYTPVLRSMGRITLGRAVAATLIAMTIAGLWHGPAWTYVLFGFLHGTALAANQIWKKRKLKMPGWAGWCLTFLLVVVAFVFFRSPTAGYAIHMLTAMWPRAGWLRTSALKGVLPIGPTLVLHPIALGVILAFFFRTSMQQAAEFRPTRSVAFATAALIVLCLFLMNSSPAKQFVYFAF